MSEYFRDVIYLNELRLCGIIGEDAWDRPGRWQPIIITMNVVIHRSSAPSIDDITLTFNYSEMYRQISGVVDRKYFHCIDHVLGSLSKLCLNWPGQVVELTVSTPESVLRLEGGMKKVCRWRRDEQSTNRPFVDQAWFIETLKIACIVGIQPHERVEKQTVHIKIQLNDREDEPTICRGFAEPGHFEWRKSVRGICELVEASSCWTIEGLASLIAKYALEKLGTRGIGVHIAKPNALALVESAGVEVWRDQDWLRQIKNFE